MEVDGVHHKKGVKPQGWCDRRHGGDPLKDTSGPSLNILLKLMSVIALVIAPCFLRLNQLKKALPINRKQSKLVMQIVRLTIIMSLRTVKELSN